MIQVTSQTDLPGCPASDSPDRTRHCSARDLKAAEFTDEDQAFVLKYYDESAGEMPGESAIRDKIRQEEEATTKPYIECHL